ncbi:MAG: O-antigen ligase family protein, partial [Pseudomonadota bacterium]
MHKHSQHKHRRHKRTQSGPPSQTGGLLAGVFVLALISPLALGGVHRPIVAVVCAICCVTIWALAWRTRKHNPIHIPLFGVLLLGATTFTLLQILPLPFHLLSIIAPDNAETLEVSLAALGTKSGWYPISLDAEATLWETIKIGSCTLAFIASHNLLADRQQRDRLLGSLVIAGSFITMMGLVGALVAPGKFLFVYTPKFALNSELIRTSFVNPNHAAAFLTLCTILAMGLALGRRNQKKRVLFLAAAALTGTGVFLTLSRGGIVTLCAALLCFGILQLWQSRDGKLTHLLWVLVVLVVVLGLAAWMGYDHIVSEYDRTISSGIQGGKLRLWSSGLGMVLANPLVGVGRGAFMTAFTRYIEQGTPLLQTYSHMENQYLHLAAEWGIPVGLGLILASGLAVFRWWMRGRQDPQTTAVLVGLCGLAGHNLVDFNLEILGLAMPAAILTGILSSSAHSEAQRKIEAQNATISVPITSTKNFAVALAAVGVFLIVLCGWSLSKPSLDPDVRLARAVEVAKNPKYLSDALALLESAIKYRPADYLPHLVGAQLIRRTEPKKALEWINRALFLYPMSPDTHVEAARILRSFGRRRQALLEYELALPNSPTQWNVLSEALPICHNVVEIEKLLPEQPKEYGTALIQLEHNHKLGPALAMRALKLWP